MENKKVDTKKIEELVEKFCQKYAGKDSHSLKKVWHDLDAIKKEKNKIKFLLAHTDDAKVKKFLSDSPDDKELDNFADAVVMKLKSL
ncbi:MAG: hypothetical protein JW969_19000 [Spirochaetales bacterium]|nr:hypothetical protein [Spirochaetales bacterium]